MPKRTTESPKPEVHPGIITPQNRRVRLNNCPVGLFWCGAILAVMTEYWTYNQTDGARQRDAYIVESGEYFWGGVSNGKQRARLLVTPCDVTMKETPHAS